MWCTSSLRSVCGAFVLLSVVAGCNDNSTPPTANQPTPADPSPITAAAAAPAAPTPAKAAPTPAKLAPTPATIVRATELKDKPATTARTLKKLAARTAVTVIQRQGGWLQVSAQGQQGWVRLLHVSAQPSNAGGGTAKDVEAAKRLATGRAGGGNIVATSGIRGLNEEQLRSAAPDPAALAKLDGYAATDAQAADYARTHGLTPRRVKAPAKPK